MTESPAGIRRTRNSIDAKFQTLEKTCERFEKVIEALGGMSDDHLQDAEDHP